MNIHSQSAFPILLVHGGAGKTAAAVLETRKTIISDVLDQVWPFLLDGATALYAVNQAVELLESDPNFNAGIGSSLQSDGLIRLSAAIMDGHRQAFSGVSLATHMINPSRIAMALQDRKDRVVGPLGAQLIARELGLPPESPLTLDRVQRWVDSLKDGVDPLTNHGTVGAVAIDLEGKIAAATSTGGNGASYPDRVSDSSTAAGNYATRFAGISTTGQGEQIVDDGLAVRLETRVRDGRTLVEASDLCVEEARQMKREYGWIGVDYRGFWAFYTTTPHMPGGVINPGEKNIFCE